ncbi:MAG: ATP-binding protein [Candidatus Acidiferrales bacterium]
MPSEEKGREPAGSVDIQRTFPAQPEAVDAVLREIMEALEKNRCPVGDFDEIRLALREALNNAVKHGSGFDTGKKVHVAVRCNGRDGFWISIRDEGRGFDPDKVPDPTVPENLERFSGRGLFMIRELMDDVQFHDRGREIRMLRRPRPAG